MLTIDERSLGLLKTPGEALLLGIITNEGRILLREAGEHMCPGHIQWARSEPEIHPGYGFSLIARNGLVTEIFRTSALNVSQEDRLLPRELAEELMSLLPVSDDLRVYGN